MYISMYVHLYYQQQRMAKPMDMKPKPNTGKHGNGNGIQDLLTTLNSREKGKTYQCQLQKYLRQITKCSCKS